MANGWTPERRQRQAEAIRRWQPWSKSTGPRSTEGKAVSSRNGWKGGTRPMLRQLGKALRSQRHWLDDCDDSFVAHHAPMATTLGELEAARQAAKERGDAQARVEAAMGKAQIVGLLP